MTSTALATKQATIKTELMGSNFQGRLTDICAQGVNAQKYAKDVLLQVYTNPKLAECTIESIAVSCLKAAAQGVQIDGEKAHLIPRKNNQKKCVEASLSIDYKGYVAKALDSGALMEWDAYVVCQNDIFTFKNGKVDHEIDYMNGEARGDKVLVYSKAVLPDGTERFCVMTKAEVMKVKAASPAKSSGPWVTWEEEMWKKSVIRRHRKTLPLKKALNKALNKALEELMKIDDDKFDPINITNESDAGEPDLGADPMMPTKLPAKETKAPEAKKEAPKEPEEDNIKLVDELIDKITPEKYLELMKMAGIEEGEALEMTDPKQVHRLVSLMKAEIGNK